MSEDDEIEAQRLEQCLRRECLRLAVALNHPAWAVTDLAESWVRYILDGPPKPPGSPVAAERDNADVG